MRLEIKKFSWEDILPHKVKKYKDSRWQPQGIKKQLKENGDALTHWITHIVRSYIPKPPHGRKWSALCIYMNNKNLDYLNSQIDSWLWLDIGPRYSDKLADNEYGVNPAEVLENTP